MTTTGSKDPTSKRDAVEAFGWSEATRAGKSAAVEMVAGLECPESGVGSGGVECETQVVL